MDFDWTKVRDTIATVAPSIATALGGPLAGAAVQALSLALTGAKDTPPADIAAAITSGGADALLKLKQAEQDFQVKMRALDIDVIKLDQQDRANAREREIKTGDVWTPRVLAAIIVTGYFSIQWYLIMSTIPDQMMPIVMRALGTLDAALGMALAYFFGSSVSSQQKNDILAATIKK